MGIPGNTGNDAFRISEYVFTYQKHEWNKEVGWEYLGIPNKCPGDIRICT